MATRGPKPAQIILTDDERSQLESWARRRTSAAGLATRSKIVLAAAEGGSNTEVAARLGVSRPTVTTWRSRFAERRLDGLVDEPRPGRPRTVTDEQVERLVVQTLETTPADATHWSTRSMATHLGMSQTTVSRVWRAFGLAPHKADTWKLSKDPLFVDKVRDVVGLYLDPPERALVLCVDEKTQIQALDRTQPVFPMLPGSPARASHDYVRNGTSSLYAALDITTGKVIGSLHSRHRAVEFGTFLRTLDREVPAELDVHLVLDNASTHKTPTIRRWLAAHPRFVRPALHPDQFVLAQSRRALVRRADHEEAATLHPPLGPHAQRRRPSLDQDLERQSQALRLDQNRRRDPRQRRSLLQTNH